MLMPLMVKPLEALIPSFEAKEKVPEVVSLLSELLFGLLSEFSPEPAGREPRGGSPCSATEVPWLPEEGRESEGVLLSMLMVSVAVEVSPSASFSV